MSRRLATDDERRYGRALADHLSEHRQERGLTGQEVAERSGLSIDAVRSIESGRVVSPGFRTIAMIARAIGVNLDTLATSAEQSSRSGLRE